LSNPFILKGDSQTFAIIGAAMEVHKELGSGFLEAVYPAALEREFSIRNVPFVSEPLLPIFYKGISLPCTFRADFVCYESVVVEIKAASQLHPAHIAQVLNQLKAAGCHRGLPINFGSASLEHKRIVKGYVESDGLETPRLHEDSADAEAPYTQSSQSA
jgi:GxxExxY protein